MPARIETGTRQDATFKLKRALVAGEAATAQHQFIEKEHMLIGLCSLEELLTPAGEKTKLTPQAQQGLQAENDEIESVLQGFELEATQLRHQLRETLGQERYKKLKRLLTRELSHPNIFVAFNNICNEKKTA